MGKNQYRKLKNKTLFLYKNTDSVVSKAFNGEKIYFDPSGFRHLIYKGKDSRSISDQVRRFKLFSSAVIVLKEAENIEKYSDFGSIKFWSFSKIIDQVFVVVIVRQIGSGKKHFFSVMPRKRKDPREGL